MELVKFKKELDEVTDPAIKKVGEYLLTREDIHKNLEKENKSLNEMWNYIVSEARRVAVGQCAAVDSETVFGWAVHYYDEDNLKVVAKNNYVRTAVTKDNSSEEIEKYKNESKAKDEEINKLKAQLEQKQEVKTPPKKEKKAKPVKTNNLEGQLSLFDVL